MPTMVSAAVARALLQGLAALGFDAAALQRAARIPDDALDRFDALVDSEALEGLLALAMARGGREELPTEVGLAVPYGAFGALDYLAGTAADVASGCEALARHFRQILTLFILEVGDDADGGFLRILWADALPARHVSDEFTLAVVVAHFRAGVDDGFGVRAVRLTRSPPARPTHHAELFGAPVTFGCAVSALEIPRETWVKPLRRSDPVLQRTLRELAVPLVLPGAEERNLVVASRRALSRLLPGGACDPKAVARTLGLSARSLQRRLQEAGTSFSELLDRYREAEAERLLTNGVSLSEVAIRLGFSDQASWNRAFRRWKGMPPRAWLASRPGPSSLPPGA
jgi:AraC-like DNA-binding protein